MSMTTIIGIAGLAGAGKDTAAEALLRHCGYTRMALADPIKIIAATYFGVDVHAPKTPEVRGLYQRLGTEVGRAYDPDCWVKFLEHRIGLLPPSLRGVVIPDVRFRNEAEWVLRKKGLMIYIEDRGGLEGLAGEHASEIGIRAYNGLPMQFIHNDRTIEDLHVAVLELWSSWVVTSLLRSTDIV